MKYPMELLAPAGSPEALRAAVKNGAAAVYLGGKRFGARMAAANFSMPDLETGISYAHARKVKIYVTVNTLVADQEMASLATYLYELYRAGVDALIVQDVGVARLARAVLREMELHASTQMTINNRYGLAAIERWGFARVILARETSLEEMAALARASNLVLESFVHGALCMSYSGQCFLSSLIGGRSGNRGVCAQPCRQRYELLSAASSAGAARGKERVAGWQSGYLLSTRDLNLMEYLEALGEAGVGALKIEGRMKRPEYVAVVTRAYRRALDGDLSCPEEREALAGVFNRGFCTGYLLGHPGRELVNADHPGHRGSVLGKVEKSVGVGKVLITLNTDLAVGDGLQLIEGGEFRSSANKAFARRAIEAEARHGMIARALYTEKGKRLAVARAGQRICLALLSRERTATSDQMESGPEPKFRRAQPGDILLKTYDSRLMAKARKSYLPALRCLSSNLSLNIVVRSSPTSSYLLAETTKSTKTMRRSLEAIPLDMKVWARLGETVRVEASLREMAAYEVATTVAASTLSVAQAARQRPLNEVFLRAQLGRLGDSPFRLGTLTLDLEGDLIVPVKEINQVRRALVQALLPAAEDWDAAQTEISAEIDSTAAELATAQGPGSRRPGTSTSTVWNATSTA